MSLSAVVSKVSWRRYFIAFALLVLSNGINSLLIFLGDTSTSEEAEKEDVSMLGNETL